MSYGMFSEVYLATCFSSAVSIKIGETSNSRRRNSQLYQNDYHIIQVEDVDGGESARKFVESYLRVRIEATERATRHGLDYFECDNSITADWIKAQFTEWVKEANKLLDTLYNRPARPEIPAGYERMYQSIFRSIEKCGEWRDNFQCRTEEQETIIKQLDKSFSPLGYICVTHRNYSWAYFEIRKK